MELGHASDAPESGGSLSDLASFVDTLETAPEDETEALPPADETTAEEGDTEDDATDGQDEAEESQDPEAGKDGEPAPERKLKVTTKSDSGEDVTEEVAESELVKGYQRQADYTRKTSALAERESQAVEFLKGKHEEMRSHYLQQAEVTRAAVTQMAGIKTEAEMAELANTDPAQWVAESHRQTAIAKYLSQLDEKTNGERQRAAQEADAHRAQSLQQQFQKTWEVLEKEKIDKPQLAKIYDGVSKSYGFTPEELGNVYDHRLVRMMRDAQAYQTLKDQKPAVTAKAVAAPRLPTRQASPAQDRKSQALTARFRSGRASLNDLAQYID